MANFFFPTHLRDLDFSSRKKRTMRQFFLLTLAGLLLFSTAGMAQETPSARFASYLTTVSKATKLSEVRPYFSKKGWEELYGMVTPDEEAEILKLTAEDLKGWKVKSEKIVDGKAALTVGPDKGDTTDVTMIKEGGVWVIDG